MATAQLLTLHCNTNLKKKKKPGVVVHACNPNYTRDRGRRILSLRPTPQKLVGFYLKNKIQTKTWKGGVLKW
jgi:hypothetical protein